MEYKYIYVTMSDVYFRKTAFAHRQNTLEECKNLLQLRQEKVEKKKIADAMVLEEMQIFYDWAKKNGIPIHASNSVRKLQIVSSYEDKVRNRIYRATGASSYFGGTPSFQGRYIDSVDEKATSPLLGDVNAFFGLDYEKAFDKALATFNSNNITKVKNEDRLRQAIEYCVKNELDWNMENAYDVANYNAERKWQEENYPIGTTIEIKCCDECNYWTVGDRRCSCGNRRVDLAIGGNFIDGFYSYGETY